MSGGVGADLPFVGERELFHIVLYIISCALSFGPNFCRSLAICSFSPFFSLPCSMLDFLSLSLFFVSLLSFSFLSYSPLIFRCPFLLLSVKPVFLFFFIRSLSHTLFFSLTLFFGSIFVCRTQDGFGAKFRMRVSFNSLLFFDFFFTLFSECLFHWYPSFGFFFVFYLLIYFIIYISLKTSIRNTKTFARSISSLQRTLEAAPGSDSAVTVAATQVPSAQYFDPYSKSYISIQGVT